MNFNVKKVVKPKTQVKQITIFFNILLAVCTFIGPCKYLKFFSC